MKGNRLKTLGFALLGGLAFLFAGCGQQQAGTGGGTGGAVTSVGIELPSRGPLSDVVSVKVNVNEGAQVKSVVLKVDGQVVNQITVQGIRPQALTYSLTLDTAQLDPNTKQPKFLNGTHTLSVEVTDVNNNTKTASTQVVFLNNDRVRGLVVSQTDNPKAPVTVAGTKWYGNGDVLVTVDIVNYSGATYSITGSGSSFSLSASGGQGGTISSTITVTGATATPVSGQPQLVFKKSANSSVSSSNVGVNVVDSSSTTRASVTFGLDNVAPGGTPTVQARRPLKEYSFAGLASPTYGTSATLFRGSEATDSGVKGLTYTVKFSALAGDVTVSLPDAPSAGQTVSGLVNGVTYSVSVVAVEDALGNKATVNVSAGSFTPANVAVQISNVSVSNTQPNAGTSFRVSANVSGGYGTTTGRVGLLLGTDLIDLGSLGPVIAYAGAQYVVYAVDDAGNFAVQPLSVSVQQPSSDKTAPTLTLPLPSSVAPSGSISVSGSWSDNISTSGTVNLYASWAQNLGGYNWYNVLGGGTSATDYASTTSGGGSYSATLKAPNYTGTLRVVAYTLDGVSNLGSASGTVNVQ